MSSPSQINRATEIIAELAVNMYRDLSGWDDDYQFEVDQVRDFMLQTVEDCSECYDEDWFPILAVPAAEKTVNYRHVTQKVQEQFDDLNWREFTRTLFV